MSHWHHKTINLALIPPAAYSQFPQFITREHHQRFQFAPAFSIHYTRILNSNSPQPPQFITREFINPDINSMTRDSNSLQRPQFITREFITRDSNSPQPPQFITCEFITPDSNSPNSSPAIPIRLSLLNSSHASDSNSPQPPQFITCEFITPDSNSLNSSPQFQFAPASSIHHTRIHHLQFQFAPASSIHHTRIHHPRFQFAVLLYMYNSAHSPLPPLIRPYLLSFNPAFSHPIRCYMCTTIK